MSHMQLKLQPNPVSSLDFNLYQPERIIMKTIKSLITISTLLLGTTAVFAASHAGAPMAKDTVKKEAVAPTATPSTTSTTTPTSSTTADMSDGEVRKVDKENKKITLKHGVIKNLDMPGMTMVFGVKDAAMLDKVKAGEKVKFKAEQTGTAIVVTDIQPAK